jgi:predicted O-linked N-acetylglucosamine transferase (SPINDLY family)
MNPTQIKLAQVQQLLAQGKKDQARAVCLRLTQSVPGDPGVNAMMAAVLMQMDQPRQAIFFARRAHEALPHEPELLLRLAHLHLHLNEHEQALGLARDAVALGADTPGARSLLSTILSVMGRLTDAAEACMVDGRVPVDDPDRVAAAASALLGAGMLDEGVALYRTGVATFPDDTMLAANLCNALVYHPGEPAETVFEAHRRFGALAAAKHGTHAAPIHDPDPDRPLRVGVLSPDLRRHSVGYFMRPLFEHHDRAALTLFGYDTMGPGRQDDFTAYFRERAAAWRPIGTISWRDFTKVIRDDRIDVLVELSGHTAFHSLELLPYRPAPVQITYLGYPHTTGLSCVDFRVVDSHTDPAGDADRFATERLLRLDPSFLCFTPPDDSPQVAPPPSAGHVTFGSFNAAQKLNAPLLRLWARVLHAVPGSRLFLKAMSFKDERLRRRLAGDLTELGVDASRLEIVAPDAGARDHLAQYARVDIALDTFPYHGTTTTCESLHMGVPVVTLAGDTHASRVGVSILTNVGEPGLIAASEDDYVRIAADLAGDAARRTQLRASLRGALAGSPLRDGPGFARRFEAVVRTAWRTVLRERV